MLWIKACHIISMVAWFSGLFYLPRLYVYHAGTTDNLGLERFKVMERRLYYGIMWPALLATLSTGLYLLHAYAWRLYQTSAWLHYKLGLVLLLVIYHLNCGWHRRQFARDINQFSGRFFRFYNEFPTLILVSVVLLVVVKPH